MIDHVSINVQNLQTSRDFYKAALAPLGYSIILDIPDVAKWGVSGCSIGEDNQTRIWLSGDLAGGKVHIALSAKDPKLVDAFYKAAIDAGGTDNGTPGIRDQYGPNYYAAFVLDLDGNNLEAVCRVSLDDNKELSPI